MYQVKMCDIKFYISQEPFAYLLKDQKEVMLFQTNLTCAAMKLIERNKRQRKPFFQEQMRFRLKSDRSITQPFKRKLVHIKNFSV